MKKQKFEFCPRTGFPDEEWDCTVVFEDDRGQKPVEMFFHVWLLGRPGQKGDLGWRTRMENRLSSVLGYRVVLSEFSSGNGHGGAVVERA